RESEGREVDAARAADEGKLTGRPNHGKTLELLDRSLAERADNECTTFALIEMDGMDDVAATLGVLGSDELLIIISRRLKEALPAGGLCGRVAGDKFAVVMTAGQNVENIIRAAIDPVAGAYWG